MSAFHPLQTLRRTDNLLPMRWVSISPVLFVLSACGATGPFPRTPDARVVDDIEGKLSKVPCIGPMSRWERHYSFSSGPSDLTSILTFGGWRRWFDYNSIGISYRQAGFEEFRPRRVLYRGSEPMVIDDRQYDLVFGHYDVPSHTAYIWTCGLNFSGGDDRPDKPKIVVH
jgi:hypothetical protein